MLEIASLKALAPYVTGPMKAISVAKMMIWGFNKYQMRRLRRFLATLELELDDGQAVQKLIEMANDEKHQDRVGQLLEKVRRADNIWTTCCLAGVVANYMRKGFLDTDDAMLADVLTELTDMDLELFVALKPIAENEKLAQAESHRKVVEGIEKSLKQNQEQLAKATDDAERQKAQVAIDNSLEAVQEQRNWRPNARIDRRNIIMIPNKRVDDLQAVRSRVDRLVRAGALSGDIGGFGNTGIAHGNFVWNAFSDQLFEFVSRFKDAAE